METYISRGGWQNVLKIACDSLKDLVAAEENGDTSENQENYQGFPQRKPPQHFFRLADDRENQLQYQGPRRRAPPMEGRRPPMVLRQMYDYNRPHRNRQEEYRPLPRLMLDYIPERQKAERNGQQNIFTRKFLERQGGVGKDGPSRPGKPEGTVAVRVWKNRDAPEDEREKSDRKFIVHAEGDVLLIPLPPGRLKDLKVRWLADAIATKYQQLHGRKHRVLVTTFDNYLIREEAPLGILVNERVKAKLLNFNKYKLMRRFWELLQGAKRRRQVIFFANENQMKDAVMDAFVSYYYTGDLNLKEKHLPLRCVSLILRILREEDCNVGLLDLSGNFLGDGIIQPLMDYLRSNTARKIILADSGITKYGIRLFGSKLPLYSPLKNMVLIIRTDFGTFNEEMAAAWTEIIKQQSAYLIRYVKHVCDLDLIVN